MGGWIAAVQAWPIAWFLLALVLAPLIGLPASPLFVALGLRLPPAPALLAAAPAIALNLILSFLLGRTLLRKTVRIIFQKLGYTLPDPAGRNDWEIVLLCRITPGIPVFAGNYLLPLVVASFRTYFIISLAVQFVFAMGFIALGQSMNTGAVGWLVIGVCLLAALTLLVRMLNRRLKLRGKPDCNLQV